MSQDFDAKLSAVKEAILKRPPFVSGTLGVSDVDLKLYYGDVDDARCINLGHATPDRLDALTSVCQPATFGVNQRDVLDETYRKAGNLDISMFASLLKVEKYGLIDTIRDQLLQERGESTQQISYELYKLNVYDRDSFFKPHKDTPRSDKMFGSLVVIFPTPHEGGALVLREDGREWTFDYAAELAASSDSPNIAYVAFFGDIEHEVRPVTSGHRVTLTYNLYFDGAPAARRMQGSAAMTVPRSVEDGDARLAVALRELLQDPTLLPQGGLLAFGLRFMYPLKHEAPLQDMVAHMKGSDAMVVRVCQMLGLDGRLGLVYAEETWCLPYDNNPRYDISIVVDRFVDTEYADDERPFYEQLLREYGGERVRDMGSKPLELETRYAYKSNVKEILPSTEVFWATELTKMNTVKETFLAFGNQADLEHQYGHLAYFVQVKRGAQAPAA